MQDQESLGREGNPHRAGVLGSLRGKNPTGLVGSKALIDFVAADGPDLVAAHRRQDKQSNGVLEGVAERAGRFPDLPDLFAETWRAIPRPLSRWLGDRRRRADVQISAADAPGEEGLGVGQHAVGVDRGPLGHTVDGAGDIATSDQGRLHRQDPR